MLTIFLISCFLLILTRVWQCLRPHKLPPGPLLWPYFRYLTTHSSHPTSLHTDLTSLSKVFGHVFGIRLFGHYTVVISSLPLIKKLFRNRHLVGDRPHHASLSNYGITWQSGIEAHRLKVLARREMHKLSKPNGFIDSVIKYETDEFIKRIDSQLIRKRSSAITLNNSWLNESVIKIMMTMTVGQDFGSSEELIALLHKFHASPEGNAFKFPNWIVGILKHNGFSNHMNELKSQISNAMLDNVFSSAPTAHFIQEIAKVEAIDNHALIELALDIFSSGTQPLAELVTALTQSLAQNVEVQENIFQEIRKETQSCGNDELSNTIYRKATLFETFRTANVLPIPLPRKAVASFHLEGYAIPKDTTVIYNLDTLFGDKAYWGSNVGEFIPERFLNATKTKIINTERMVMFGFGSRSCLGEKIVWKILMSYLTNICMHFKISTLPGCTFRNGVTRIERRLPVFDV